MTGALDIRTFLEQIPLSNGGHEHRGTPDNPSVCATEAVAWLAGEPHSDHPECLSPILGQFLRTWNDTTDQAGRDALKPYLPKCIGTAGDGKDEQRGWLAADWLIRVHTPAWLELGGITESAAALRALPPIRDPASLTAARPDLSTARSRAAAARDAAWDAARDAAWDAAGAAAWDAAGAAARDAAGAAAWAAAWDAAGREQAGLLRDVFGSPFTVPALKLINAKLYEHVGAGHHGRSTELTHYYDPVSWLTRDVVETARRIYDERAFDRMPVLADALEEAGCGDADVLWHCRGLERCPVTPDPDRQAPAFRCNVCGSADGTPCRPIPLRGPHVRGCWLLDGLLGKE